MASAPQLTLRERRALRALVLDELLRLEETTALLGASLAEIDEDLDPIPLTDREPNLLAMREHVVALFRQAEADRADMRATQDRIETADFGFCEICHEFVGADRLLAVPTTKRCVRCAT